MLVILGAVRGRKKAHWRAFGGAAGGSSKASAWCQDPATTHVGAYVHTHDAKEDKLARGRAGHIRHSGMRGQRTWILS